MITAKTKGTLAAPALKILPLTQSCIKQQGNLTFIEGYANTKNKPDRYGDIPSVFRQKRNYVYELTEFKKNPVLLIDHVNRIDHLAGSVTEIYEDAQGLYFKALFSASAHPTVAHARQIYTEGHAKGISIAGRFHYEDSSNPQNLTLAEIFEISLVAVPADPDSLVSASEEEQKQPEEQPEEQLKESPQDISRELSSLTEYLKQK